MYSMLNRLPMVVRTRSSKLLLALGAALLVSLGAGGAQHVRAQVSTTFGTNTAVQPGGTLIETVNTAGFTITSTTPVGGCAITGIGSSVVTYTCASTSAGIAAGTPIVQTFAGPGSGPVSETIT